MIFIVKFTDKDSGELISEEIYSTRRAATKAMTNTIYFYYKI